MDFNFLLGEDYEIIDDDRLYVINGGSCTSGGAGSAAPSGGGGSGSTSTPSGGSSVRTSATETTTSKDTSGNNINKGTPQNVTGKPSDTTRECGYVLDEEGAAGNGHAGSYVQTKDGYSFFEVNVIPNLAYEYKKFSKEKLSFKTKILSENDLKFPSSKLIRLFKKDMTAGVIQRDFKTKQDLLNYLKLSGEKGGYDKIVEFKVTEKQSEVIFNASIEYGKDFYGYHLINNSCGIWANKVLTTEGSGVNGMDPLTFISEAISPTHLYTCGSFGTVMLYSRIPNGIDDVLKYANPGAYEYSIPK